MISEFEDSSPELFPFQLITAARGDADSKTPVFERQDYDACTVEYVERGRGFLEINGFSCAPGPDSIYILSKHSTHRYTPDRGDPWKKLFFVVDGELMESLFRSYRLTETYFVPDCPHLKEFFLEMFDLPVNTEEGNLQGALVFHHLLSELSQRGTGHVFVYTKWSTASQFESLGFYRIADVKDTVVFLENKRDGFESYLQSLENECGGGKGGAAVIMNARIIEVCMLIPRLPAPSTIPRQATNGIQLPIYPQAYPWDETESILSGSVTSVSMAS